MIQYFQINQGDLEVELKRKIYGFLKSWKETKKQECLLIKGARQIGKTYIVRKFGQENYDEFLEINFVFNPEFLSAFDGNLEADQIISRLTAIRPEYRFETGKTLLFLDEIQECPNARTALKSLAMTTRCDVIASGSLLGIKYKKSQLKKVPRSIPVGYERQITMHSLSFEEFLWSHGYGDEQLTYLKGFFTRREMVPEAVNGRFHQLLRDYIVVGGMPEVVADYVDHRHYGDVQIAQETILNTMVDDIHKYAEKLDVPKIESCYRAIPRILSLENHKFKYSEIEHGGNARKYLESVEWLNAAHLSSPAECVRTLEVGLSAYVRDGWFKLYMADIGLLMSRYGMLAKRKLLDGTLAGSMKGGIYENLLAGMLERNGLPLYYHKTESGDVEMEFVVESEDGIIPLEVKATNGATQSLNKLLKCRQVPYGYKFTSGNIGVNGKKITLPHYMAMFIMASQM